MISAHTAPTPTRARYVVIGALCTAASIAYLSRNFLGVAIVDGQILADLNCSKKEIGWVMGVGFFTSYAIGQLPGGWLGQRFGSRVMLSLFAFSWSILTLLAGFSFNLLSLMLVYIAIGAAQAGLFPNSANSLAKWFPSSRRALVCGALGSFMSIGGAIALNTTGLLLELMSWRWVYVFYCLPGIGWALWFYYWFRDAPAKHRSVNTAELDIINETSRETDDANADVSRSGDDDSGPSRIPWSRLASFNTLWMNAGQQFFRAAGYIFYSTWFPTYLKETKGVTTTESAFLSSLPLIAVVIASTMGGWLVDLIYRRTNSRRLSRQLVGAASMFLCACFLLAAYFVKDATLAVLIISLGMFCGTFAGPCAYTVTIETSGEYVPICFSLTNMTGNFGAALCPIIVELVAREAGWNMVLFLFVGFYLLATICWLLLNPNRSLDGKNL